MPETTTVSNAKKLMPIGELFSKSFKFYQEHYKKLMLITLILVLPMVISQILPYISSSAAMMLVIFIVSVASIVIAVMAEIVLVLYIKEKNLNFDIKKAFFTDSKNKFWSFIWISILVGLVVMGGMILFIIPGIYWMICFIFASYILIDQGKKGWEAAKESKRLVKGNWWPVFGRLALIYIVIFVVQLALMPLVYNAYLYLIATYILTFIVTPFALVYTYFIYENLKK